jgi:fatty acid desaturase 2 (delta-6 desaturase)
MAWQLYASPKSVWKHKRYLDMSCMTIHFAMYYSVYPNLAYWLFTYWLAANYIFVNFALSHTHLPVTESPTHWVEYGLIHTANVKSSLWVDWWMGFLNFQIEHHLFPTLPQFRCHLVSDRVRALADKYQLPYHELSYSGAYTATIENFRNVAKHFA